MDIGSAGFAVADTACAVLESAPVGRRYHRLVVAAPDLIARTRPGQFFHLLCRDGAGSGPFLRRPMSVWRIGADGRLGFLLHVKGLGTSALAKLRPGDSLSLVGPLGQGFTLRPEWRRILILARGVGLATLAPLTEVAAASGIAVRAVLSARAPQDLMSAEFVGGSGATIDAVYDSDGSSEPPAVEALLHRHFTTARPDAVFTCGSNRLFQLLQRLAVEYDIPGQVALEQQMGCGVGMCFCCVRAIRMADGTVAQQRVCTEGPVFDLQQALAW